jgi:hypothetical protein
MAEPYKIQLRLPVSLAEQVKEAADKDGVSFNTFVVSTVAQRIGAQFGGTPEEAAKKRRHAVLSVRAGIYGIMCDNGWPHHDFPHDVWPDCTECKSKELVVWDQSWIVSRIAEARDEGAKYPYTHPSSDMHFVCLGCGAHFMSDIQPNARELEKAAD